MTRLKLSISFKLLLSFLLVSMLPAGVIIVHSYRYSEQMLKQNIQKILVVTADRKTEIINDHFKERLIDVSVLSKDRQVIDYLQQYSLNKGSMAEISQVGLSPELKKLDADPHSFLTFYAEQYNLRDALIISVNGEIIFSLAHEKDYQTNVLTGPFKDNQLAKVFKSARLSSSSQLSDFRLYQTSNEPAAFAAVSVLVDGVLLGVVAIQFSAEDLHNKLMDYRNLGETGEVLAGTIIDGDVVYVNPLRHDPQAAFKRKVTIGSHDVSPLQEAAMGGTGLGVFNDYRGIEVLAAWQFLEHLKLGIVVKIDVSEVYQPIVDLKQRFLIIAVLSLFLILLVALFLARTIAGPVQQLKSAIDKMADGDLAARAKILSGDEFGELATSFNSMVEKIKNASILETEQGWLKTGITRINQTMLGERDIATLLSKVIAELATYLDAKVGAFYLCKKEEKEDALFLMASYAYKKRKNLSSIFKIGEGLVGQVALEKKQILIKNVPEDYLKVTSGLGEISPRFICVTPVLYEETIMGVIELGTLREITDLEMLYLEQTMSTVAVNIQTVHSREKVDIALTESQRLGNDLQVQQEELKASNDELEEQTQLLKNSEEKLKVQQEELEATNEELEEKNESLEQQKNKLNQTRLDIEEKAKELAIASKYKSEFLANMSHELRTPLNSLMLLSQHLENNKEGNLSSDQIETARIIYNSGKDLLALINEILDLSKIESGKMELKIDNFLIEDFAVDIRDNFQHMAQQKGIDLTVNITPSSPIEIVTDRQRIQQVVKNLISNAIKFTDKGGVTINFGKPNANVDLTKSGLDYNNVIEIAVTDTGIGVAPDKQKIIFEAFQQAEGGTARKYGGTGLGLSISRELVAILGGEIQLSSNLNKGSVFSVYLPVKMASGKAEYSVILQESDENSLVTTRLENRIVKDIMVNDIPDDRDKITDKDTVILIIEDDPDFAKLLLNQCHEKGYKCLAATSGENGLSLIDAYKVNAIILDIKLPGISGWTVLEMLKNMPATRHIPVHIMSGEDFTIDAFKRGAIGFLTKPATEQSLDAAFKKLEDMFTRPIKNLLVVEDNDGLRKGIVELIGNGDVKTSEAVTAGDALAELQNKFFDCMILELGLPDMSGYELLKKAEQDENIVLPPVIIYTEKDITQEQEMELSKYAKSIIIKGVRSDERLLDEASLFLHRVVGHMPSNKQKMILSLHNTDVMFKGRKVLITDDDMRNVFALSKVLEEKGLILFKADNGQKALDLLQQEPDIELVLMDIMMPVLDGYETMKRIRQQPKFEKLPIIALTAKAMAKDRELCIDAGASDYLEKPVDVDRLFSMMRVWLYR
jgi:signal transduction histidine kinase/DNA-binding response OmpR family regulator/HAMP domain-containing protein